jgi:hypothetical protein
MEPASPPRLNTQHDSQRDILARPTGIPDGHPTVSQPPAAAEASRRQSGRIAPEEKFRDATHTCTKQDIFIPEKKKRGKIASYEQRGRRGTSYIR